MKIFSERKISINTLAQRTDYIVGSNLLANFDRIIARKGKQYDRFFVFADKKALKLFGKPFLHSLGKLGRPVTVSTMESTEQNKDLGKIEGIVQPFFKSGIRRDSCLICLGGGIITDVGGFMAAIILRGIDCIYVPTTLLAQVDAAIGGKTGVNLSINNLICKNMLGTFRQPVMVISDIDTLQTLPKEEVRSGLGEIVKYWVGWGKPDVSSLIHLRGGLDRTPLVFRKELMKIVSDCQEIKIDTVQRDPLETNGIREKLNLGHTIGHAIEGASGGKLSHGEAVSIGLVAAAILSCKSGLLDRKVCQKIIETIVSVGLSTKITASQWAQTRSDLVLNITKLLKADKKGGAFVLIKDIGHIITGANIKPQLIDQVLSEVII